jgi:hypothetical protein
MWDQLKVNGLKPYSALKLYICDWSTSRKLSSTEYEWYLLGEYLLSHVWATVSINFVLSFHCLISHMSLSTVTCLIIYMISAFLVEKKKGGTLRLCPTMSLYFDFLIIFLWKGADTVYWCISPKNKKALDLIIPLQTAHLHLVLRLWVYTVIFSLFITEFRLEILPQSQNSC